ncbi:MAG: hypothetical protein KGJ13_11025, partial [Patescibacteria group bacterium]|nr:hypothetical protein [Patescibacteria group bacterium]
MDALRTEAVKRGDRPLALKFVTVPEPAATVLHPKPLPVVQVKAFVGPSHDPIGKGDGVPPVAEPSNVFELIDCKAVKLRDPVRVITGVVVGLD